MNRVKKALAIVLSFVFIISIFNCSCIAVAEDSTSATQKTDDTASILEPSIDTAQNESPVLYEIEEKRNEFSKTYIREDGSYTTVFSKQPIHQNVDGEWIAVDNTLKSEEDSFVNESGLYDVEFPDVLSEDKAISITNEDEVLSFTVNDIGEANAVVDGSDTDNTDTLIQSTSSSITYASVSEGTDINYILSPEYVKENIVISNKNVLKDTYSFDINKGDLSASIDENGEVVFQNSDNETVFVIPAPVMYDAKNISSKDINVVLTDKTDSIVTLEYTPSKDWLNNSDREYPVVLDPVIVIPDFDDNVIEDTAITSIDGDEESRVTNYSDSVQGIVGNNDSCHSEVLVKLQPELFEFCIEPNVAVTNVNYVVAGSVIGGNLVVKPVVGDLECKLITYNDVYPEDNGTPVITYEDEIIDYYTGVSANSDEEAVSLFFNITTLFKEWLNGERDNNGFVIMAENEDSSALLYLAGEYENNNGTYTFQSYCSVDYVDASGQDSDFESITQQIGRAGTANVNLFTRNLSLYRSDISMQGELMPVEIGFNYNPALVKLVGFIDAVTNQTDELETFALPYGNNWLPSCVQMIYSLDGEQYQFYTGNGSVAVFNLTEETEDYVTTCSFEVDESTGATGYSLEFVGETFSRNYSNLKIVDSNGNELYFNDYGMVVEIREPEAGYNNIIDKAIITYDDENPFKVTSVADGSGRKYIFNYSDKDLLISIHCVTSLGESIKAGSTDNNLSVYYTYDGRDLVGVTYPDNKVVSYSYSDSNDLLTAENIDGYNITYTYDNNRNIVSINEFAGTTAGNTITITELGTRQIKVVDSFNGTLVYQFGADGKLNYTFDDKGNVCKDYNAPASDENVFESNSWFTPSQNLLKNSSFEVHSALNSGSPKNWSNEFERVAFNEAYNGDYALKVSSDENITAFTEQTVNVKNVDSYTFSAYVKSETAGVLTVGITATDDNGSEETVTETVEIADDWSRVDVTYNPFTANSTFKFEEITVKIGFEDNCGTYYVDAVQLEEGNGTAGYNLLNNGSFNYSNNADSWDEVTGAVVTGNIYGENVSAIKLSKGLPAYDGENIVNNVQSLTQTVSVNGKKGDVYSVGGWFKGMFYDYKTPGFAPSLTEPTDRLTTSIAQVKVSYNYTEPATAEGETAQTKSEEFVVDFAPHNDSWQFASDSFALKGDVANVNVTVLAQNMIEDCFVTDVALVKNVDAAYIDLGDIEITDDSVVEETEGCKCENCEELDCSCRCVSTSVCSCAQCKRQSSIEVVSEDGKQITNKSFDGTQYMQTTINYSDDFNSVSSETDANNITSHYGNNINGTQSSYTDGAGNSTTYSGNAMGYIALAQSNVSGLTDNAVKMAVSFAYNGDLLTGIDVGDVDYTYTYDGWGQLKSVSVDESTIVSYNYGTGAYRTRIKEIVFGNTLGEDFSLKYTYDSKTGNVTSVKKYVVIDGEESAIKYDYSYDNLGNLVEIRDNGTGHRISYNENGTEIKDIRTGQVIYSIADVTPDAGTESAETNENEPVSITQEAVGGVTYTHNIFDTDYNEAQGTSTNNEYVEGGKTIGVQSVSDWFGRNKTISVMTKNPKDNDVTDYASITAEYTYKTTDGVTTNLVSGVNNTITGSGNQSVNYAYTYDSRGKITGVTSTSAVQGLSNSTQFVYDEAGQLVKEITGQNSVEYAYDSRGNITSRKKYSGENLVANHSFGYGEAAWEDKLTSYNNQSISYDELGNPTSYMGATLTWRGRELVKYEKGNKEISYSYDVDGMRYRKVVKTNGTETSRYDYVYSDGRLVVITYTANGTSKTARFIYDSYGEVRGFILDNSATYLYLKNAQGDITAIIDENGAVILTCTYDAWGVVTFGATSMESMALAAELSKINPFTYRGYCYDYDIEMYYLQSRYYDPEICRFINADSTDYLGATGTLLSYNLFAYCENDPVGCVDETGTTLSEYLYRNYNSYLKKQSKNSLLIKSKNSEVLISVSKNNIYITAYMYIYGDLSIKKITKNQTYKDAFRKGIEKIWSGVFYGVFGETVTLKTKIYLSKKYAVKVNMLNKYGASKRTSAMSTWRLSNLGSIKIYKGHTNKVLYSLNVFNKVAAHEFGHILGGMEVYGYNYSVLANNQKYFKLVSKDIERLLKSFITNKALNIY